MSYAGVTRSSSTGTRERWSLLPCWNRCRKRCKSGATRVVLKEADRTLFVLSLDVFSFRDAQRALAVLEGELDPEAIGFLVNRAQRTEVTARDVERVFGRAPIAVIPFDRKAAEAQDRGRLLPRRSRLGRAFDRLAADLTEEVS